MNTTGKTLFDCQQNNEFLIYSTNEPIHYPHSGQTPSTIDLLLSISRIQFNLTTHHDHFLSDHAPIICSTTSNIYHTQQKIFDYARASWTNFRRMIDKKINVLSTPHTPAGIDAAFDKFTELLTATKIACISVESSKFNSPISANTKRLIQEKNASKRRWQRCNNQHLKPLLKRELNKIQKEIKS